LAGLAEKNSESAVPFPAHRITWMMEAGRRPRQTCRGDRRTPALVQSEHPSTLLLTREKGRYVLFPPMVGGPFFSPIPSAAGRPWGRTRRRWRCSTTRTPTSGGGHRATKPAKAASPGVGGLGGLGCRGPSTAKRWAGGGARAPHPYSPGSRRGFAMTQANPAKAANSRAGGLGGVGLGDGGSTSPERQRRRTAARTPRPSVTSSGPVAPALPSRRPRRLPCRTAGTPSGTGRAGDPSRASGRCNS
jgi:hypothetical protein